MPTREHGIDILVRDPIGKPRMAVEIKARPLHTEIFDTLEWKRLLAAREKLGAPYGLLFSPGDAVLVGPEGITSRFEGQSVLDLYDVHEIPRFQAHSLIETALYTWLADLTLGIERPLPMGFPTLFGDEVERSA